jgi:uncharacterized repeat protein (TIGR04138 family)
MKDDPVFVQGVKRILDRDDHWPFEAFDFVRKAVEKAIEKAADAGTRGHVAGPQIVESARDLALQDYGAMAVYTLGQWKLQCATDVGHVVFLLIEEGLLAKSDDDRLEDFENVFDLAASLAEPFTPRGDKIEVEKID